MKNSQNLMLYFAASFAMLASYVISVVQQPTGTGVLGAVVSGLAVCALVQAGSDLLMNRKEKN